MITYKSTFYQTGHFTVSQISSTWTLYRIIHFTNEIFHGTSRIRIDKFTEMDNSSNSRFVKMDKTPIQWFRLYEHLIELVFWSEWTYLWIEIQNGHFIELVISSTLKSKWYFTESVISSKNIFNWTSNFGNHRIGNFAEMDDSSNTPIQWFRS